MALEAWGDRLSPDIPQTFRRFPLAVLLAAIATAILVAETNELALLEDETAMRAFFGAATAAVFATAGVFFAESRPRDRTAALVLMYVVPIAVVALFQVRDTTWFVPYALPVIAILWLSISPFTQGWRRRWRPDAQNRFWWLNHRAVATAAIAGLAVLMVGLGLLAIERTVALLFRLDASSFFFETVLPIIAIFFAPLYWLSTLPRLSEYDERVLAQPDFLARAVGLVGKFVLIPLLLAYAAILFLYSGQIALTLTLPQGTLGWMVLGFVVAGAGAYLVLHPAFMRDSAIVRVFRQYWFWLTVIPLILFALAVFVRIDNYGLTPQRLILFWGGLWAILLTLAFLLGRGDIRMIPGLAALILALATIGPWNLENLPRVHQSLRLDALLTGRNADPSVSLPAMPVWKPDEAEAARGAIVYLSQGEPGRQELARVLRNHGHDFDPATINSVGVLSALAVDPSPLGAVPKSYSLSRDFKVPVDVSATPLFLADLNIYSSDSMIAALGFSLRVDGMNLVASRAGNTLANVELQPLIELNDGSTLPRSVIDFAIDGIAYRLVADSVSLSSPGVQADGLQVDYLEGTLFKAAE